MRCCGGGGVSISGEFDKEVRKFDNNRVGISTGRRTKRDEYCLEKNKKEESQ